jgi:cytochrome c556
MKIASSRLTVLGAGLSFVLLAACGGGGGPPADADTPEGQAFEFRDAVMHVAAYKLETVGGMAREEIPLDEAVFVKSTADLAAAAGMIVEGFQTEGIATGSRALPDIWSNWDDFQKKANDTAQSTAALAEAAANGGFAAAQSLVQPAQQSCGACHRAYRARTE